MTKPTDSQFRQAVLDAANRLQGKLIRYTSRFFAGDENQARDVVQHAFLQLCRVKPESRPEKIDAWLYRVCRNRAIDQCRQSQRMITGEMRTVYGRVDLASDAHDLISDRELWTLLQQRIGQLPAAQREAIDLWSGGLRYAEIAEVMDRLETTVRVIVHRGLAKLRSDPMIRSWLTGDSPDSAHSPIDKIQQTPTKC